jgi:hypothetical protein
LQFNAALYNPFKIAFKVKAAKTRQTVWLHKLGSDEFVASFGSSGAEHLSAAGGGHSSSESDMFGTSSFVRSVSR